MLYPRAGRLAPHHRRNDVYRRQKKSAIALSAACGSPFQKRTGAERQAAYAKKRKKMPAKENIVAHRARLKRRAFGGRRKTGRLTTFLSEAVVDRLEKNRRPSAIIPPAFPPKALCEVLGNGRSSGSPPLGRLPIGTDSGLLPKARREAYSSGDCSGFAPDSLLSLVVVQGHRCQRQR